MYKGYKLLQEKHIKDVNSDCVLLEHEKIKMIIKLLASVLKLFQKIIQEYAILLSIVCYLDQENSKQKNLLWIW